MEALSIILPPLLNTPQGVDGGRNGHSHTQTQGRSKFPPISQLNSTLTRARYSLRLNRGRRNGGERKIGGKLPLLWRRERRSSGDTAFYAFRSVERVYAIKPGVWTYAYARIKGVSSFARKGDFSPAVRKSLGDRCSPEARKIGERGGAKID